MSGNWLRRMGIWVCLLALVCPAQSAGAQEREHETVVVTAGRVEEKARTVTQAVTVISNEEIEKKQYQNLGELLRTYGVPYTETTPGEGFGRIYLRGMSSTTQGDPMQSSILVLVDGRRMASTQVSMIPMVSIDRVEIIRGPASVQYGTTAIGGVINIITKRGGKEWHGAAELGYGSWDAWRALGGLSGSVGAIDMAGGVQWSTQQDNYYTSKWKKYDNSAYDSKLAYNLNLGVNFLEEHRLGVSILGTQLNKIGVPGSQSYKSHDAYTDNSNQSIDITYDGGAKKYGLNWKMRYFNALDKYVYDQASTASHSVADTLNQGIQAQASWQYEFLTLTGGVDWLASGYRAHQDQDKSDMNNIAGFLLAKVSLFDEMLILSGGLRHDGYTVESEGRERTFDNTSFSLGAAVNPTGWLTLRANYGQSYRVPTGFETMGYSSPYGPEYDYIGNPDLNPEKGQSWDIGFEVNWQALNLGLTYFETNFEDSIATGSNSAGQRMYVNIDGLSHYRGLEGRAKVDIGSFFDWPFMLQPYMNFTHLFQYDDPDGEKIKYVSAWQMGYGVNFSYPTIGFDADLRFTYFGKQKVDDYSTHPYQEVTLGNKTIADFFISKTIYDWEEKGKLSIKGEIRNIFNERYYSTHDYPMPGRSFYVGLRYDF